MPEISYNHDGPEITASGRLRDLEGRLLFGQSYPLSVTARDPDAGLRRIEILVDGQTSAVWEYDCPGDCSRTVDWSFDPATVANGPHRIAVRAVDRLDKVSSLAWTVIKSEYADRTEDEIVQDSLEFRPDFGLSTDPAHIDRFMHAPAYERNWVFDVPLTHEEVEAAEALEPDGSQIAGEVYDVSADPSSASEEQPHELEEDPRLPDDPIARYGATEAAGVYAGNYIGDGAVKVGFTQDAARHLEQLRSRTARPLALFEVRFSLDHLTSLLERVSDDMQEWYSAGIHITEAMVVVPENVVVVGTKPLTAAQRQAVRDRYGPAIRLTTTEPSEQRSVHDGLLRRARQ